MGPWSDLTGETAANAAKAAAADTYGKQNTAIGNLLGYGDQYANSYKDLGQSYNPWISTGQTANSQVQQLLADPSSITSMPYYQTGVNQGTQAITGANAATGNLFSGKTGKDLTRFGEDYFNKNYGDQLSRLLGISNQGLGAQGAQNTTVGQGLTGQLGTRSSAYNGQMTAAGTIGQGDIAAANARTAGANNLLGAGLKLGGMALGSLGGGMGGLSSLLGGGSGSTPSISGGAGNGAGGLPFLTF